MRWAAIASALWITGATAPAFADESPPPSIPPSAPNATASAALTANTDDAPPPAPYAKGLVVDASIGAIGFLGQFGKLAPPGPWFHGQVGYELLSWLMIFGEGELAFTDTSNQDNPPNVRTFDLFGFGGGARFTWRFAEHVGIYGQPGIGAMKADIARNELGIHGFHDAESLNPWLGFRVGLEWYQIDRHFALGLTTGIRTATGFAKTGGTQDTPLALDGGVALRYSF